VSYRFFAQIGHGLAAGLHPLRDAPGGLQAYGTSALAFRADSGGPPFHGFGKKNRCCEVGALAGSGRSPTMRTALIAMIVLVRFGPDVVYGAHTSLPQPDPSRQTTAPKWIVSPPAVVVIRPPS
jgi:hypothetical protein